MRAATAFRFSLGAILTATAHGALMKPQTAPRTVVVRAESSTPAGPTSTEEFVDPFVTPDPWPCALKNITQYFDVSTATGGLYEAMTSYGDKLLEPCESTAGPDVLCSVTELSQWCGMSTAIPPAVLADYSSYVSGAYSFWSAKSSEAMSASSYCPVFWERPSLAAHRWLNLTIAFAECYAAANPGIITSATGPSSTKALSVPPTPSSTSPTNSVVGRSQGIEMWMLASTGMAAAAVNSVL
ncbi:uncharacterized protein E0L32_008507 [Thyridium curvatum]|uniref:DUF7735 domain-containing protein n=1 Tax=Thyridium curvatum TaxID=1093900 RepID=A0A507B0I5_9PEZI|nr:uncharacterized protein E0L32_008507 [Thyridium curvatum]TPX10621.1 hypothetical protein E0L32_008507 [Thyridium curvatum]